jgi:Fanconi anemia group M protein
MEEERGKIFTGIITQSQALTLFHMLELLETQGLQTLKTFLEKVELEKGEKRSYALLVSDPIYFQLKKAAENTILEHPKVEMLEQIVKDQTFKKPSSRLLVFTQYRDTASHLVERLNGIQKVKADRFVGQATKLQDKGLTQKEQAERIRMLENGQLNVLVATSIAEEGLDIPAVDHVIFYEPIPSEIRYIQRRGRTGRKAAGKVTILATNESLDMIYLYANKKRIEKMKTISENINQNLQTIIRKWAKPPPNPLKPNELKMLEDEVKQAMMEPELVKPEVEATRLFKRNVERVSRALYIKLLERGAESSDINQIASDMEYEVSSLSILKAAIDKLIKENLITETNTNRYLVASAATIVGKNMHQITIEKIYPNLAVVVVDDKWRARLTPEEYNGPRVLMKKNSKFKAIAYLYRTDGKLCIRIDEVTKILN